MKQLRQAALFDDEIRLATGAPHSLNDARGDRLEISIQVLAADCETLGIQLRRSPDGDQFTELSYDYESGSLRLQRDNSTDTAHVTVEPCECRLALDDGEPLNLTLYLDNSVIEVYANARLSMTSRIYPSRDDAQSLQMVCADGSATAKVAVWQMGGIWGDAM